MAAEALLQSARGIIRSLANVMMDSFDPFRTAGNADYDLGDKILDLEKTAFITTFAAEAAFFSQGEDVSNKLYLLRFFPFYTVVCLPHMYQSLRKNFEWFDNYCTKTEEKEEPYMKPAEKAAKVLINIIKDKQTMALLAMPLGIDSITRNLNLYYPAIQEATARLEEKYLIGLSSPQHFFGGYALSRFSRKVAEELGVFYKGKNSGRVSSAIRYGFPIFMFLITEVVEASSGGFFNSSMKDTTGDFITDFVGFFTEQRIAKKYKN